ncbi:hypothetical protein T484DRAFT_1876766 [Baffinella frigidus]|nr:hypothetical protein T484DRAFT_1876766 [Cryptophyta sp. CCMP2293]
MALAAAVLGVLVLVASCGCHIPLSPPRREVGAGCQSVTLIQLRETVERRNLGSWGVSRCENGLGGGGGMGVLRGGMREDHVDMSGFPQFSIVNPDENEPMKFVDKPGQYVPFEFDLNDKKDETETRAARLERLRRRREGILSEEPDTAEKKPAGAAGTNSSEPTPPDPVLVASILSERDVGIRRARYLAEAIEDPEEREATLALFNFQEYHNASWDPRDLTWENMETFFAARNESSRTDQFRYFERPLAEQLQEQWNKAAEYYPPAPTLLSESPIPRLCTWIHSGLAQHGIMWDMEALREDVTVHRIHACSVSDEGPQRYALYTTEGRFRYKMKSERQWTIVGGGMLDLPYERGEYGEVPLDRPVVIRAGATQAFYLHCLTSSDGVAFRMNPVGALDAGEQYTPGAFNYVVDKAGEEKGVSVDGVLYSEALAEEGAAVDRDTHLVIRTAAFAPEPKPFEDVSLEDNITIAFSGLIDYEVNSGKGMAQRTGSDHR